MGAAEALALTVDRAAYGMSAHRTIGPMPPLSKAQIKHFSGLLRPQGRAETGLFLAHGRKVVEAALAAGWPLEALVMSSSYAQAHGSALGGHEADVVAEHELAKLSDQPAPEGVVAVLRLTRPQAPQPVVGPALLVWQLNDPGNVGALLRIAAWYGLAGVWLSPGSADPFGPKAVRGAMGATFTVPCGVLPDFEARVAAEARRVVAAAVPHGGTTPALRPDQLAASGRDLLLLGSESHGVPPELLNLTGLVTVSIAPRGPQPPESLNVAVAAGILVAALVGPR